MNDAEAASNRPITSLSTKLRLKPGCSARFINLPVGVFDEATMQSVRQETRHCDVSALFATNLAEMRAGIEAAMKSIRSGGVLWVAYPKKSSGNRGDLHRESCKEEMLQRGHHPVTAISIDDTWTALRFKPDARD